MRIRLTLSLVLVLILSGCRYSSPAWQIESYHVAVNRDENRFGFAVASSLERQPEGFVATFPDGGTPIVKEQKITVWSVVTGDNNSTIPEKLAEIPRPADIVSGLNVHCIGWETSGAFYIRVTGHAGKTSDTAFLRHVIRINPDHTYIYVTDEPDLKQSLQAGPPVDQKLFVDFTPIEGNLQVSVSRGVRVSYTGVRFRVMPDGDVRLP